MQSQPPTPARLAANRANAAKSTGRSTPQGKANSRENAPKRTGQAETTPKVSSVVRVREAPGLRSQRSPLDAASDATLPIEREEFLATLAAFTAEFAPATPFETRLVERLAQLDLHLTRAMRIETTHFAGKAVAAIDRDPFFQSPVDDPGGLRVQHSSLLLRAFYDGSYQLNLIARYSSRISRDFSRTLRQLREAQSRRESDGGNRKAAASGSGIKASPAAPPPGAASVTVSTAATASQKVTKRSHQSQRNTAPPLDRTQPHPAEGVAGEGSHDRSVLHGAKGTVRSVHCVGA